MIKKVLITLFFCFLFAFNSNAQTEKLPDVKIDLEPQNIEEFLELRGKIAQTPEGGATMFILALYIYGKDATFGKECITAIIDKSRLSSGDWYKGYEPASSDKRLLVEQMERYPFLPNSYFEGSTPENAYQTNSPFITKSQINPYSGDLGNQKYKLFVFCSGANSPRPVTLRQNDKGIWKVQEWSSILSGIQAPEVEEDDDL